jgi:hypothetical protein
MCNEEKCVHVFACVAMIVRDCSKERIAKWKQLLCQTAERNRALFGFFVSVPCRANDSFLPSFPFLLTASFASHSSFFHTQTHTYTHA